MIIHGYIRKSKPKKLTKAEQTEYDLWLRKVGAMTVAKKSTKKVFKSTGKIPKLVVPAERSSRHIPSLNPTNMAVPHNPSLDNRTGRVKYTGDKMIGIGTLHKSNAVPVFTNEEAKDMAKMRR